MYFAPKFGLSPVTLIFLWWPLQRSCVHWWSLRPFRKTRACLSAWPTTPLAQSPARPYWRSTTVRGVHLSMTVIYMLQVHLSNYYKVQLKLSALSSEGIRHILCTPACRPGGAAGGRGHMSAGSSLSQAGGWGRVPAGFLLQEEQWGLSPSAPWLYEPPPSWVAWKSSRR